MRDGSKSALGGGGGGVALWGASFKLQLLLDCNAYNRELRHEASKIIYTA